jgi:hypothetical protein
VGTTFGNRRVCLWKGWILFEIGQEGAYRQGDRRQERSGDTCRQFGTGFKAVSNAGSGLAPSGQHTGLESAANATAGHSSERCVRVLCGRGVIWQDKSTIAH